MSLREPLVHAPSPMRIPLTPGQAVSVHGWLAARQWLTWGDVLASDTLTFKSLLSFRLSEAQLHNLQPDIHAWIRNHKVQLEDAPSLLLWTPQPVKEMKADLADIDRARRQKKADLADRRQTSQTDEGRTRSALVELGKRGTLV